MSQLLKRLMRLGLAMNLCAAPAIADTTQERVTKAPNGFALTPPMGWNSWNKFACNVNEQVVRDTSDAMVASGMRGPIAARGLSNFLITIDVALKYGVNLWVPRPLL